MANWYVWSGATGTGSGADWTNAKTTLAAAVSAGAAGDTYYVAHDHAESAAASTTITMKGTSAAPDRVLCVNRAGSVPPVSADLTTGASITTTGNNNLNILGVDATAYFEGITFNAGSGAVSAQFGSNLSNAHYKNCNFNKLGTTGTVNAITLNTSGNTSVATKILLENVTMRFGSTGDGIQRSGVKLIWKNSVAISAAGAVPNQLFRGTFNLVHSQIIFDGVDLNNISTSALLGTIATPVDIRLINCRLSSGITWGTPGGRDIRIQVEGCDSGTAAYRNEIYDYAGTLTTETTIVRTGGASDGTTPVSRKIVTNANCKYLTPFESFPIYVWCDTTGSAKTLTVEIINGTGAGVTLKDGEVWLELQYLGNASYPLASRVSTGPADVLAGTGSNLPTSSETWTTTGLTSPVKQYIQATFTPQMKGWVRAVLKVAKASQTLYVCPKGALA